MRNLVFALLLALASAAATAQETPPDQLMKAMTDEVLALLKQEKPGQGSFSRKLADLVEHRVLPHFDFARMTRIAAAAGWRRATPEQQQRLVEQFRTLLVRTYSNALSLYRGQTIDFKPLRAPGGENELTVRSEVHRSGRQPVALDYEMEKTPSGWKVYDVKVGGVSLISTYREEFATRMRQAGVEGLIEALAARNRQLEAKSRP
jgi:phospholipid transport system substrate-binding protein